MKNSILTLTCCAIVSVSANLVSAADAGNAAKTNSVVRQRSHEELRASRKFSQMRRYGGQIKKEKSAYGKVVIINAQKKVASSALTRATEQIEDKVHPIWELKDVETVNVADPAADIKRAGGEIGVVLVATSATPALLIAPENGWAVVNVTALEKDCPDAKTLESRVRKELLRAFALVGGAAFMTRDPILLRPDIHSAKDLDLIKHEEYGIDVINALGRLLQYSGVMPWRVATYKKACQEGWAPAPTNEYQKAVWDKVHQLPTNPLPLVKPTK